MSLRAHFVLPYPRNFSSRSAPIRRGSRTALWAVWLVAGLVHLGSPAKSWALNFNFVPTGTLVGLQSSNPTLYTNVTSGFAAAGTRWSAIFNDPITVNVNIDYPSLGSGILGDTAITDFVASYSTVRNSLVLDAKSSTDVTAVANLQVGPALDFLTTNRAGTTVRDLPTDAYANSLDLARADAKALGLVAGNSVTSDATIRFSSNFTWDFNPNNGITGGQFDFVGVATHEIGHALGFISGVDNVDYYSAPNGPGRNVDLNGAAAGNGELSIFSDVFSPLDLFRYTPTSHSTLGNPLGLTDGGTPYFSVNGGISSVGNLFSTGTYNGDGRQASHWKDEVPSLGIMDPTLAPGELAVIRTLDVTALDAIGFDLASAITAVPEPSSIALAIFGLVGGVAARRRRSSVLRAVQNGGGGRPNMVALVR